MNATNIKQMNDKNKGSLKLSNFKLGTDNINTQKKNPIRPKLIS
tara:strand:+ start:773 stop:904 length:132 start_codon:yes stop_codon:yes gene_type:complete